MIAMKATGLFLGVTWYFMSLSIVTVATEVASNKSLPTPLGFLPFGGDSQMHFSDIEITLTNAQNYTLGDVFHNIGSYASTEYKIEGSFNETSLYFNGSLSSRLLCSYDYILRRFIYEYTKINCNFNTSNNILTFNIRNIDASYAGRYSLITENSTGIGTVFVMDKPRTPSLVPSDLAVENQNVNITANASSTSRPRPQPLEYTWLINGSSLKDYPESKFKAYNDVLTIKNLRRGDSSYIVQCYVTERNGSSSEEATMSLNVLYKPEISLRSTPSQLVAVMGQTGVTISCQITDGNPQSNVTYRWVKDGVVVSEESTYRFGAIKKEDAGTYSCTSSNIVGTSYPKNVTLQVQYPPEITCSDNVTKEEKSDVMLQCSVSANPSASYTWKKEGSITVLSSSDTLSLSNLQRSQTGNYIFSATNNLTPTGKPQNITSTEETIYINVQYGPGNSTRISPGSVAIVENSSIANIVCSATCNPPCSFTWVGPQVNNNSAVLRLGMAHRNKRGSYVCTAKTRTEGQYERSSTKRIVVDVNYPGSVERLDISGGNVHNENSNVKISCISDAFPVPSMTLYKEGRAIISGSNLSVSYNIPSASCLDSGNYTCSVRNNYNSIVDTESTFLRVRCSPKLHQDNANQSITVTSWRAYQFSATFLAYPQPQIRWYHVKIGKKLITDNITTTESSDSVYISTLSSSFSEEDDFGTYIVEASNNIGSSIAQKSFNITSRRPPNVPSDFKVFCSSNGVANLTWVSSFNGGFQQSFTILFKRGTDATFTRQTQRYHDQGKNNLHFTNVVELKSGVEYLFRIEAKNTAGATQTPSAVCKISKSLQDKKRIVCKLGETSNSSFGGIFAAGFGSAIGLLVLVAVGILIFIKIRRGDLWRILAGGSTGKENKYDSLHSKSKGENPYDDLEKTMSLKDDSNDTAGDAHIYLNQHAIKTKQQKDQKREAEKKLKKGGDSAEKPEVHIYQNSEFTEETEDKKTTQKDNINSDKTNVDNVEKKSDKKLTQSSSNDYLQHKHHKQAMTEMKQKKVNLDKKGVKRKDDKKNARKGTYENTAVGAKG